MTSSSCAERESTRVGLTAVPAHPAVSVNALKQALVFSGPSAPSSPCAVARAADRPGSSSSRERPAPVVGATRPLGAGAAAWSVEEGTESPQLDSAALPGDCLRNGASSSTATTAAFVSPSGGGSGTMKAGMPGAGHSCPPPWARSPWRSASASVDRGGRCWCRAKRGRQPAVVRGFPGAVRDRLGENGVDVPDQVRAGAPMPYGSLVKGSPTTVAYRSCAASPASTVSSPVMASAWPCWNFTRQRCAWRP